MRESFLSKACLSTSLILFKKFMKTIALVYIYQLAKFGYLMSCGSKNIFKNKPCLMNCTHHDVINLGNNEIVNKNTKI